MIIDVNASAGTWPSRPLRHTTVAAVRAALASCGVERIYLASLAAAWYRNPHLANDELLAATAEYPDISPVPTLDPTIHTWRDHLAHVAHSGRVQMIRLLPAYSPYPLTAADEMLREVRAVGLSVQVQTRIEDPRLQHPLMAVPDVPVSDILQLARRHPSLTVVIGGARFIELLAAAAEIRELNLVYADTSQCDGMDAIRVLCEAGLTERLLFGSHAPLFEITAGLRRVTDDLDDGTAELILGGNAARAL